MDSARDYLHTVAARPGWQASFDRFAPGAALLGEDTALAAALVDQRGWRAVARDGGYVLLQPPAGETRG